MKLKNLLLIIISIQFQLLVAQSTISSVTLTVDMSDQEVAPEGIFVIGNFFNGTPEELDDNGDGTWSYPLSFTIGDSLFYLFSNGAELEELKETTCTVGVESRRVLVVPETDTTLTTCFNYCVSCSEITTSTNNLLLENLSFQVSPNPMQAHTTASWKNSKESINRIQLWDMVGRKVRTYNQLPGTQLTIERANLSRGIYLLEIQTLSGKSTTQKIMVQ